MEAQAGPEPSPGMQFASMFIASVIRNALEDFHVKHLSDEQMKELNPIIRNAVYTALHALENQGSCSQSRRFYDANMRLIPPYWEEPAFLEHYLKIWKSDWQLPK